MDSAYGDMCFSNITRGQSVYWIIVAHVQI